MNREALQTGTVLRFPDGQEHEIVALLGGGGSALLYETKILGSELYAAVKEIYPTRGYVRKNGQICPSIPFPRRERELAQRKQFLELQETRLSQKASRKNHQILFLQPPVWHTADIRLPDQTEYLNVENTYARMDSLAGKGISLSRLVQEKRPSLDEALQIMSTVLDAYAALYEDGFLHGDCQMSNLFFLQAGESGAGTACIIDFGSARELGLDGFAPATDPIFSTDGYCAPELMFPQVEELRITTAADVWSLGFLLLNLLTDRGYDKIGEKTKYLVLHPEEKILTDQEAATLGCTPAQRCLLNDILSKALANEPELRIENASKMRDVLKMLVQCRAKDFSKGLSPFLLWDAAWRYQQENPSLFWTEHQSRLSNDRIPKRLDVEGRLEGRECPCGATRLLEEQAKENRDTYLYGSGGAGKSFTVSLLVNAWMKSGERVPFYLDLARFTAEALDECHGYAEQVIPFLLAKQYFGRPDLWADVDRVLCGSMPITLVLDNLHKMKPPLVSDLRMILDGRMVRWPNVWVLIQGRAEFAELAGLSGIQHMEMVPLSQAEITEYILYARDEVLSVAERKALHRMESTLALPMFLMRYLELIGQPNYVVDVLPDTTMELLHNYFSQKEYDVNGRYVHDILNDLMPWIAWKYEWSEQTQHTRGELVDWLQERFRWRLDEDNFFQQVTNNLAIMEADSSGSYRFVHDCYQEYFAALFAATRLKKLMAGTVEDKAEVESIWENDLMAHCLDLCCLEHRDGRVVRACNVNEVLDLLHQQIHTLRHKEQKALGNLMMALYGFEVWRSAPSDQAERWLSLMKRGGMGAQIFAPFARMFRFHGAIETPLYLRVRCKVQHDGYAEYKLAFLYHKRGKIRKCIRFLQKAVALDHAPSMTLYGEIMEEAGEYDQAITMYTKAAQKNYSRAMWNMGRAYLLGQGVPQDDQQAYRYLEKGARYGVRDAQKEYARLLENGIGCPIHFAKALYWYEKAAEQGADVGDAIERLSALLLK